MLKSELNTIYILIVKFRLRQIILGYTNVGLIMNMLHLICTLTNYNKSTLTNKGYVKENKYKYKLSRIK